MLLRYFSCDLMVSGMGNLLRNYFLLLVSLSIADPSFADGSSLRSPYLERFKRQIRATKTELTISSLYIQSTIVSRYAFTKVQSVMYNPHNESKEAIFDLELPSSAFMSNFTLTVNGNTHVAEVKEKHQAKKMYEEARRQGKTTAHVGTRDRETEKFRVSMNVEAGGEMTFTLTYEELLRRHLGKYEHAVSVRPGQIVQNLTVLVTISERTGIDYVRVLPLRASRLITNTVRGEAAMPPSTEIDKNSHCARVTFQPTPKEQALHSNVGIVADFVVQYDVTLKDLAGDVQIYNGYFVHYFAPRGLPTIQKNVIFVIDVSGSMFGTKMKQTKSAMHVILNDLHRDDSFNIITFSDVVQVWKPGFSIQATVQNIKSAKEYVNKIEADGWTDINAAILAAASIFNHTSNKLEKGGTKQKIPLVIFLTDGEATSGVTSSTRILVNAQKALKGTVSLFCLAFGEDADYNLMRRLSLENRGIARRIYEYSDATLQLKGFYDEIASPLLFDIELAYREEAVQNVTQTLFPNFFEGSELVVAGKLKPGTKNLQVRMTAHDQKEKLSLDNDIHLEDNATQSNFGCSGNVDEIQWFVQRLWAYFTIQDLLQARIKANDTIARKILTEKATNLSLKYNFVTPVTSLIVVKPDDSDDPKTTTVTSMPSTATLPVTPTSHTTINTTVLSTAVLKAKSTSAARLTRPAAKTPKPSTMAKIGTMRPTTGKTTTTSQVTGTRAQPNINPGTPTANTLEKITTMPSFARLYPTNNTILRPNTPLSPTGTLHPSSLVTTGTTTSSTEKLSPTSSSSESPSSSVVSSSAPATETVQGISASSYASTLTPDDPVGDEVQESPHTEIPTSVPVNPTSLRLLILSHDTELLPGTYSYPTYVESLNPPPVYSYFEEIKGVSLNTYSTDDLEPDIDFEVASVGAPRLQTFMSSVDGDPHFVVNLPQIREKLCFTLDGRPGDTLRLLSDPDTGITVNGHLMKAPLRIGHENRLRTYLDIITITINQPRCNYIVNISLDNLTLKGEKQLTLPVTKPALLRKPKLAIKISPSSNITVWIGRNVELLVLFHHYQHPTYLQLSHLGFYIVKGDGLSSGCGGLLGQFQNAHIEVTERKQSNDLTLSGILRRNNHTALAILTVKSLKDSTAQSHMSKCWLVKHTDVEEILDGKYMSYVVSDLQDM
ncbi:inter-alpha-trypsin inhibitor heavy chain H6 isoform X2 [Mixophyes fleayi]|uniref:inter-alpha-trypsin inhibitor heavy chain H6 isoform X2 n=1 Tax=Mixophyes fleayi TaxID=3061075 RepID=UPI003F4E0E22